MVIDVITETKGGESGVHSGSSFRGVRRSGFSFGLRSDLRGDAASDGTRGHPRKSAEHHRVVHLDERRVPAHQVTDGHSRETTKERAETNAFHDGRVRRDLVVRVACGVTKGTGTRRDLDVILSEGRERGVHDQGAFPASSN